ncbi:hypothetical protein BPAE_0392g00040 [Botrytis paeoniae]|uniref:Uncharacterized protein n=1 Tax=Botrytis paeoniae TaxID=278948 RepID=A0A4Z1FA07_9HELO|nr:hypothetical protein BPAE_0392g00040 [Botrytis paeoniae]
MNAVFLSRLWACTFDALQETLAYVFESLYELWLRLILLVHLGLCLPGPRRLYSANHGSPWRDKNGRGSLEENYQMERIRPIFTNSQDIAAFLPLPYGITRSQITDSHSRVLKGSGRSWFWDLNPYGRRSGTSTLDQNIQNQ